MGRGKGGGVPVSPPPPSSLLKGLLNMSLLGNEIMRGHVTNFNLDIDIYIVECYYISIEFPKMGRYDHIIDHLCVSVHLTGNATCKVTLWFYVRYIACCMRPSHHLYMATRYNFTVKGESNTDGEL